MPYVKDANEISFTRLRFVSEDVTMCRNRRDVNDEANQSYNRIFTFRDFMARRFSADEAAPQDLGAQILLAQLTQDSDE